MVENRSRLPWRKVKASNVYLLLHIVLFIICLIVFFAFANGNPTICIIVMAIVVLVLPQLGILGLKFYARSKVKNEMGVGNEEANRIINGTYHQLDTYGLPDPGELSYYLTTRGFEARVTKPTELFLPKHKLFINLQQTVSTSSSSSHHHRRPTYYYSIQLGPTSPQTEALEEQLKNELGLFLTQKGLMG